MRDARSERRAEPRTSSPEDDGGWDHALAIVWSYNFRRS
jgi:hypothetical protein